MHRREVRLAFSLFLGLGLAGSVVGCEEEFSDEPFGTLDLAPVYDGGTPSEPCRRHPPGDPAQPGLPGRQRGRVLRLRHRPPVINPEDGTPIAVRVQPMYFFFDQRRGRCSPRPVREVRDGTDWIKGGPTCSTRTPRTSAAGAADRRTCQARNARRRRSPTRPRSAIRWSIPTGAVGRLPAAAHRPHARRTASRPGASTPGCGRSSRSPRPTATRWTPSRTWPRWTGRSPRASSASAATGKVINCPLIDERTYVLRGVTSRRTFHPRIELWYRRQLATCFLANGWETLGREDGVRWFANQDDERLDTFDVARVTVGSGAGGDAGTGGPGGPRLRPGRHARRSWMVPSPVARPATSSPPPSRGRTARATRPATAPMRWMFDVTAPGRLRRRATGSRMADIDPGRARPQPGIVRPPHRAQPAPARGAR